MHLKSLALVALSAAGALANLEDRQLHVTDSVAASVLLVLATALPPDSISQATANPSAFAADLASSVSAGDIPGWYQSLPADVKSYLPSLYPANAAASTTAPATSASTTAAPSTTAPATSGTAAGTGASISGSTIGFNSTVISTVSSPTLAPTSSVPVTGAASYPTVVAGAGVAGAMAFLGMLAM